MNGRSSHNIRSVEAGNTSDFSLQFVWQRFRKSGKRFHKNNRIYYFSVCYFVIFLFFQIQIFAILERKGVGNFTFIVYTLVASNKVKKILPKLGKN